MRVLVVEDDALIARGIVAGLRSHGLTVDSVGTAAEAEAAVATGHLDVLVLDIGLPDACQVRSLRGEVIAATKGASNLPMDGQTSGYATRTADGTQ